VPRLRSWSAPLNMSRVRNRFRPGLYSRNPMSYVPVAPSKRAELNRYGLTMSASAAGSLSLISSSPVVPFLSRWPYAV
jgi:hypothetical protein